MMMAMTFTFVSCDDDEYIADTLWGVWQGDMHVWNEWNGNYYESHDTEIAFDRNPYEYSSGSGYWVDFYSRAPWDYFASNITWTVDNGRITITLTRTTGIITFTTIPCQTTISAGRLKATGATPWTSACTRCLRRAGTAMTGAGATGTAILTRGIRHQSHAPAMPYRKSL